jgi:adenine deaminase
MVKKTLHDLKGLMRVSNGENAPDILIEGAEIFDVFTNSIFKGSIWIYRHWIAYVGDRAPLVDANTIVIDAKGYTAVPGYIDAHGHADLFYTPSAFADHVVARGTTTVFSDAHDMVNSIGYPGFIEVLKANDAFSLKYLWGLPATYPHYPEVEGGESISLADARKMFSDYKDCVAMSEISSFPRILQYEDDVLEKILIAKEMGRNVEGHTLGASYDKLNTLVAAGITSCHESIKGADLRNRLRLGLYTMVRYSSIRNDFKELCPVIKELPKDLLILVTDGIFAKDLCTKGYMDFVIKEAIDNGIDPKDAIKMCTLNAARYFRLDGELGSIAPGRIADIALLEDIERPTPVKVIERGRVVADKGSLVIKPSRFPVAGNRYNPFVFNTIDRNDLLIEQKGRDDIPVIDIVDRTITRRADLPVRAEGGYITSQRDNDIMKVLYTRRNEKKWGKGFVRGIGADIGGMATSVAHDTHGLALFGFDDDDMALAGNTLLNMGGGIVLADKGRVLYTLPLPNGATMSDLGIEDLAAEFDKGNRIMEEKGSALDNPMWTICFVTITSVAALRLTVSGVYDVKKGKIIF